MAENVQNCQPFDRTDGFTSAGLHWTLAAFFMVTDMAIGGMVSLPGAISRIGIHRGLALLILFGLLCCCSAILLGRCWPIVLHRFPEYGQKHCRRPYSEIGFCAFGQWMRVFVSVAVNVTQFGIGTVFLLLCAVNVRHSLFVLFRADVSECRLLLFLTLLLLPLTLLKSPNEFWPILIGGLFCTIATFVVILLGVLIDLFGTKNTAVSATVRPNISSFEFGNYLNAIGTLLFAFGGHPAMPTIQHDMKRPADFHKSALLGFAMITLFDFLIVLFAYFAYGDSLGDSVISSLRTAWLQQSALVLSTVNSLLGITLIINPLNQEVEELFQTSQEFGLGRVLVRSAVLACVLFVAQSVPNFGPFLGFVGASFVPLIAIICPFLFHLVLFNSEMNAAQSQRIPLIEALGWWWHASRSLIVWAKRALYGTAIIFAAIIGILATFFSLETLFGADFVMPCYLRLLF